MSFAPLLQRNSGFHSRECSEGGMSANTLSKGIRKKAPLSHKNSTSFKTNAFTQYDVFCNLVHEAKASIEGRSIVGTFKSPVGPSALQQELR